VLLPLLLLALTAAARIAACAHAVSIAQQPHLQNGHATHQQNDITVERLTLV
jgi:hypothetical protein